MLSHLFWFEVFRPCDVQVISNAHGDMSAELGYHLEVIIEQLINDRKSKRAACMISHAKRIFHNPEGEGGDGRNHDLALARVNVLHARLQQAQLQFNEAEEAVHTALRTCGDLLGVETDGGKLPTCTLWVAAIDKAQKNHRPSMICRSFQKTTIAHDVAKLVDYHVNKIARVVRDCLRAHSEILCTQGIDTQMSIMCAIAAAQISRMCDSATGQGTVLADCQVYMALVQHILRNRSSPLRILAPWHCGAVVARHFLIHQLSFSLMELRPRLQQRLRDCWIQKVEDWNQGRHIQDELSPEIIMYIDKMTCQKPEQGRLVSVQWLATNCMHGTAVHGTALHGAKMRLQLTMAYMSFIQVRFLGALLTA